MDFGLSELFYRNIDIETGMIIAAEAGYDAIEIQSDKLLRYLKSEFSLLDLNCLLQEYEIVISSINTIKSVDTLNSLKIEELTAEIELLAKMSANTVCNIITLRGSSELDDLSIRDNIKYTACNIRKLCDIGYKNGFRFQYEGAAWIPIHSIDNYQRLIDEVGMDNFGIAVDFWHLWVSRGGTPDQISHLDKDSLFSVYITDGFRPEKGDVRSVDSLHQTVLPGDGNVPVLEWIDAVTSIGYEGLFSGGYCFNDSRNMDIKSMAVDNLSRMKMYF